MNKYRVCLIAETLFSLLTTSSEVYIISGQKDSS